MFGFPCDLSDEAVAETFTSILMNGIKPKRKKAKSTK
jgi:hypothetical protein